MSTEVKVAHSKVMSPQNQSARMSEVPTTPGGVLASNFYEGKRVVYDRKIQCAKRLDQVERRRGTPGQQRKIDISTLAEYNITQAFRAPPLAEQRMSQQVIHQGPTHVIAGPSQIIHHRPSRISKVSVEYAEPRFTSQIRAVTPAGPETIKAITTPGQVNPFDQQYQQQAQYQQQQQQEQYQQQQQEQYQQQQDQYQQQQGQQYQPGQQYQSVDQGDMDEKDAIIDELTNQVAHLIEENKGLAYENENLQSQIEQQLQQLHQVQLNEQQFNEQIGQQQQYIDEQQAVIEELQNQQSNSQAQQIQQQEENNESNEALVALIQNLKDENESLRENLQNHETANDHILHLEQAIAKRDESHKILEERLEELNTINSNLHEYLGRLLAKLNENSDANQGDQPEQDAPEDEIDGQEYEEGEYGGEGEEEDHLEQ